MLGLRPFRASELDANIKTIKGVDEAAALRELEDGLRKLKAAFKEVKGLAQGAQEAADKCQVRALPVLAVVWWWLLLLLLVVLLLLSLVVLVLLVCCLLLIAVVSVFFGIISSFCVCVGVGVVLLCELLLLFAVAAGRCRGCFCLLVLLAAR